MPKIQVVVQMVGSVLYEKPKALPQDLQSYLESCSQGAVYVSMGTLGVLTEAELHSLAGGLARLSQCVVWKLGAADLPGAALHRKAALMRACVQSIR